MIDSIILTPLLNAIAAQAYTRPPGLELSFGIIFAQVE
jgi:hypothetical protein